MAIEQQKENTFRFASVEKAHCVAFEIVARVCNYYEFDWSKNNITLPIGCPKGVVDTVVKSGGVLVS